MLSYFGPTLLFRGVLLLFMLGLYACAAPLSEEIRSSDEKLVNPDKTIAHNVAVLGVSLVPHGEDPEQESTIVENTKGTGVIIGLERSDSPGEVRIKVLTAAHVALNAIRHGYTLDTYLLLYSQDLSVKQWLRVESTGFWFPKEMKITPERETSVLRRYSLGKHDIAVGVFNVRPRPLNQVLLRRPDLPKVSYAPLLLQSSSRCPSPTTLIGSGFGASIVSTVDDPEVVSVGRPGYGRFEVRRYDEESGNYSLRTSEAATEGPSGAGRSEASILQPGDSGGPLLDQGKIVCVLTRVEVPFDSSPPRFECIPVSRFKNFIESPENNRYGMTLRAENIPEDF